MDPSDIENTDDWLGCPTPLETCRHQSALYENEFEELNLQLQQSRERIFKLVEMHAAASAECETLRSQLSIAKSEALDASRRATDIETKSNRELATLGELAADYMFLFNDVQQLVMKANDDLVALIKVRISETRKRRSRKPKRSVSRSVRRS